MATHIFNNMYIFIDDNDGNGNVGVNIKSHVCHLFCHDPLIKAEAVY